MAIVSLDGQANQLSLSISYLRMDNEHLVCSAANNSDAWQQRCTHAVYILMGADLIVSHTALQLLPGSWVTKHRGRHRVVDRHLVG